VVVPPAEPPTEAEIAQRISQDDHRKFLTGQGAVRGYFESDPKSTKTA
jgi:hypothetical protein